MKVNVEIDCSPKEARQFLGLPDLSPVNDYYVDGLLGAMKQAGNFDQVQDLVRQFSPMGEVGMKLFQDMMKNGMNAFGEAGKAASQKK